jgi:hypothetical protein
MSEKRFENPTHWFEQAISETLEDWEYDNYRDDNLWDTFRLSYENITEEEFEVVSNDKLEELRDSLRRREIWVQKDISVAKALINTLLEKASSEWPEENQSNVSGAVPWQIYEWWCLVFFLSLSTKIFRYCTLKLFEKDRSSSSELFKAAINYDITCHVLSTKKISRFEIFYEASSTFIIFLLFSKKMIFVEFAYLNIFSLK